MHKKRRRAGISSKTGVSTPDNMRSKDIIILKASNSMGLKIQNKFVV